MAGSTVGQAAMEMCTVTGLVRTRRSWIVEALFQKPLTVGYGIGAVGFWKIRGHAWKQRSVHRRVTLGPGVDTAILHGLYGG